MTAFCDFILCFLIFSFCGWICETVFCSVLQRKFVNRGFLSGPACPVYGFGGLAVVYLFSPLRKRLLLLFSLGEIRDRLEVSRRDYQMTLSQLKDHLALELKGEPSDHGFGKVRDLLLRPRFQHRRLLDAFPNMRSLKYREGMEHLREAIAEIRGKNKKGAKK